MSSFNIHNSENILYIHLDYNIDSFLTTSKNNMLAIMNTYNIQSIMNKYNIQSPILDVSDFNSKYIEDNINDKAHTVIIMIFNLVSSKYSLLYFL